MGDGLLLFGILDCAISNPLDDVWLQSVVLDCLGYRIFDDIPADIPLVAGLLQAVPLARIVVMQLTAARGT